MKKVLIAGQEQQCTNKHTFTFEHAFDVGCHSQRVLHNSRKLTCDDITLPAVTGGIFGISKRMYFGLCHSYAPNVPACTYLSGTYVTNTYMWYGMLHNLNGPSIIYNNDKVDYYVFDRLCRDKNEYDKLIESTPFPNEIVVGGDIKITFEERKPSVIVFNTTGNRLTRVNDEVYKYESLLPWY